MTKPTHPAAQRFDTWAETYGEDRISPWFKHYQAMALTTLELDDGNVLDIGCGTGEAVRMAASQLHRGKACGIDISTKTVDKEAIPYADESFDAVLSTCSFHHYADPVRALNEMRRVMNQPVVW